MLNNKLLLQAYGERFNSECGPWNLSLLNKYLEYKITEFFEENFTIQNNIKVCNIGIGAGEWDRYISYHIAPSGKLTSIDIDSHCCNILIDSLINECNPNDVSVICADAMNVPELHGTFDLVTMIGSTRFNSGLYEPMLSASVDLLKVDGDFYYMSLDKYEKMNDFLMFANSHNLQIINYHSEKKYDCNMMFWKSIKNKY